MAVYVFPGEGRLRVERYGQDGGPERHVYRLAFMAEDPGRFGGRVLRSRITVPWQPDPRTHENRVVADALAAVEHGISGADDDPTGTVLGLYADDIAAGADDAARYREGGRASYYATVPGTLFEDGITTYPAKAYVVVAIRRSGYHEGDVIDVYRNGADQPDGRYTVGPRGGLTWEKY